MNKDMAEGNWKQITGKIKEKWGELTNDEIDEISGRREKFVGKLQEKYGMQKDEAEKEWDRIMNEEPDMRA